MEESIKQLVLASNNKGKIKEFQAMVGNRFNVIPLSETGFTDDIIEDGETFLDNAIIKAKTVYEATGMIALSDDSGLCVEELFDAPGVMSARYSGESATDEQNNNLLLQNMGKITNRTAKFVSYVVLYFGDNNYIYGVGETAGKILEKPCGSNGFGYDSVFFSDELNKSFGEASIVDKNAISHRGKAVKDLLDKLDNMRD